MEKVIHFEECSLDNFDFRWLQKKRYRNRESGKNPFDFQPSKGKPLLEPKWVSKLLVSQWYSHLPDLVCYGAGSKFVEIRDHVLNPNQIVVRIDFLQ